MSCTILSLPIMQCDRKWIGKGGEIKNSPSQGFVRVVVVVVGER